MTILELKNSIHQKVDHLDDIDLLTHIFTLADQSKRAVFVIPAHMKEGIQQGLEDLKNDHFFTLEDFQEKYKHGLN